MEGYVELQHRAAGHDGTMTDQSGLLVFKPAVAAEVEFYEGAAARMKKEEEEEEEESGDVLLERWMPAFLGTLEEGERGSGSGSVGGERKGAQRYVVLENLIGGFKKANVMDVKLGRVLWDETAAAAKRQRLEAVSAASTSGSLGFRICGMKMQRSACVEPLVAGGEYCVIDDADSGYVHVNKVFGRSRTAQDVAAALEMFFDNDALSPARRQVLKQRFWQRLQLLYNTLLSAEVRLISSSLLFVYEGDPERWDAVDDEEPLLRTEFVDRPGSDDSDAESEEAVCLSSLSLIDFAHSKFTPGAGYDENVIVGVENLISIFQAWQ